MAKARLATALALLLTAASFGSGALNAAPTEDDCSGTPPAAVMTLPAPLAKWARISCTQFGHVLSSREGWVWVLPTVLEPVFIPSQMVDRMPRPLGNRSYFTKIEVTRVQGDEFQKAYETFHEGFDPKETMPDGYRVDLTSVSGKTMRLYFFDYDTHAWAIECRTEVCDRDSRFMILDKNHVPQLRKPSI